MKIASYIQNGKRFDIILPDPIRGVLIPLPFSKGGQLSKIGTATSGRYPKGSGSKGTPATEQDIDGLKRFKREGDRSSTYLQHGNTLGRISGPWKPGNVWMAEAYHTNKDFDKAKEEGKITTRERGLSSTLDNIFSAMSWGRSNEIDSKLYEHKEDLGYKHKSQADAVGAIKQYMKTRHVDGFKG